MNLQKETIQIEKQVKADWHTLCVKIGERRAGSRAEKESGKYILSAMQKIGLSNCKSLSYPINMLAECSSTLQIKKNGKWVTIPSKVMVNSTSTPKNKWIQGEVVWLEMPEQAIQLKKNSLKGKILFNIGPLPEEIKDHKKLVAANPAVMIHADDRIPFTWAKDDAVYPYWAASVGTPPTINIPFMAAWKLKKEGVTTIRVKVFARHTKEMSPTITGEITGTNPKAGIILITSHHDTQCNNVGADDNASGVVAVLALAALMKKTTWKHTIRFIAFGSEEQLSPGSMQYVLSHKKEHKHFSLVYNLDSVSSVLGHHCVLGTAEPGLEKLITKLLTQNGLPVRLIRAVTPFGDHFAFTAFGIPAVWLFKETGDGARWQHHSIHDNLKNVSAQELLKVVYASIPTLKHLDKKFGKQFGKIPAAVKKEIDRYSREMFGVKTR